MSRLSLIISREYLSTVGKKSFILMTVLMPVLIIALCVVVPLMLSSVKSDDKKTVVVIDPSGYYAPRLKETDEFIFKMLNSSDADYPISTSDMKGGIDDNLYDYYSNSDEDIYAIVSIPDSLSNRKLIYIYSGQSVSNSLERVISRELEPILRKQKIAEYAIPELETIIESCDINLAVKTVKWDEKGEENVSSADIAQFMGLMLSMLTYMFVMIYGAMIMNGVIEEKTNRIVEVIVSSCKPIELMFGKIIGVALVGLTQITIWAVMLMIGGGILGVGLFSDGKMVTEATLASSAGNEVMSEVLSALAAIDYCQIFICFLLYFIGGYLLYAALFAAFGSAVDQPNDASQFTMPIMMIMIFSLYAALYSIDNPDGPLCLWCSIIPFTSPIVMMVRLPFDVPLWQLSLSFGLLFVTAFAVLLLSARIYRTGILMYGKKMTFREIMRWLK